MNDMFFVGSMFAGVGGICLGFQQANGSASNRKYELSWANEIDEYACATYRANFSHLLVEGDVKAILDPSGIESAEERYRYIEAKRNILSNRTDILTAGFPCQAFSIAGDGKGFDDERGVLFRSVIEMAKSIGSVHGIPRVLFLENVRNLKVHDGGRTYRTIIEEIRNLGYTVRDVVLNTMEYSDIPQNRERIYIVCFANEKDAEWFDLFGRIERPEIFGSKEFRRKRISELVDFHRPADRKYYYTKERFPHYFLSADEYESIPESERKAIRVNLAEEVTEMYEFYQIRRGMYIRKNKNGVCPTLTANMGIGGHNAPIVLCDDGIRKITPEEAFRLQGFPVGNGYILPEKYKGRRFPDAALYKQAGNSVSVPVIRLLAERILRSLSMGAEECAEEQFRSDKPVGF